MAPIACNVTIAWLSDRGSKRLMAGELKSASFMNFGFALPVFLAAAAQDNLFGAGILLTDPALRLWTCRLAILPLMIVFALMLLEAERDALQSDTSQLLDIKDMSKANGVLVHVSGGDDITLEEVTRAGELVTRSMPHEVRIVWGARVDPSMKGRARVMIVLTGVETNFGGFRGQAQAATIPTPDEHQKRKWWG